MKKFMAISLVVLTAGLGWGCSGSSEKSGNSSGQEQSEAQQTGLTDFQMENGIGPVTEKLDLGAVDKEMAEKGEKLFITNCSACHKLDERYVGPAQRDLVERRSPEYIMNMILNPAEMIEKHPEAKKMLAEYMTPMPNQNVSRDEARAILEYFRYVDEHKDAQEID